MIIYTLFSVFILFIQILTQKVQKMNPYYQLQQYEFEFRDAEFSQNKCFMYGMWSKYNPLSIISQVGAIGLFDNSCFHLHNIVGKSSQSLNLIYYDCIDYNSQIIQKRLEFIDEDDVLHQFEIIIEPLQYENIWYYLEIVEWPASLKFDVIILSQDRIRLHEIKQIQRPFSDSNIILRFGGDLIVTNSKIPSLNIETKFSYFPGFIMIQELSKQILQFEIDLIDIAKKAFKNYATCSCKSSDNYQIPDSQLDWLDKQIYISKNINCDSFTLSGWVKIKNIVQITNDFIYKFIILSANFENSFSNQNLSPFQMSYKISSNGNKIILTTYKYTFPIISIDFQNDPFLITKEISITNLITLWHNIFVKLQGNLLNVLIKFYEGDVIYEYNFQFDVNQFNCIQFKLQFGNILQSSTDYLSIDVQNLVFLNCNQYYQQQNCHFSCQDCDGPTKYNCLSCESQRIFVPEQKVCVCPYDSVDKETCQTYLDSDFSLIQENIQQIKSCSYGYFEYQGDCFKCPSILRDNSLSCIECLNNPKGWYLKPFCSNDLYFDYEGNTQKLMYSPTSYFMPDETEVTLCIFCQYTTFSSFEDQYLDFLYKNLNFKFFCQIEMNYFQCYECKVSSCDICYLSIQGNRCVKCYYGYELINGECINIQEIGVKYTCRPPNYITSKMKCSSCPINNCKYCFEYQTNDLTKCTLYKDFVMFDAGEEFKVGCALCEENYVFNFNVGKCIYQKSKISNCLRAFINLDNKEVCTLSQIHDFNIAPEISNCQTYIPNCLQCLLSHESTLKCIICQEGYTSSIINGDCYKNEFNYSKIVIEGDLSLRDGWVQRIQSFMMQFLPNKYYYPKTDNNYDISGIVVECYDGYREFGSSQCEKFCDSSCLRCEVSGGLYCAQCPLNYYQQPIRDQEKGQCSECSQLCQICQSRTEEEIQNIQPSYILTESNKVFTKKCLKPINNSNVLYDPYLQIAKYCFESNCQNQVYYEVKFTYCGSFIVFWPFGYDFGININYCNQMGIDTMIIVYKYDFFDTKLCGLRYKLTASNYLKQKIFSLRKMYFQLTSVQDLIIRIMYSIDISYYDQIELNHVSFIIDQQKMFIIQNNNSKVDIKLIDFSLTQCNLTNTESLFQNEIFGNIEAHNFTLQNSLYTNSSILNLQVFKQIGLIIIKTLMIQKCVFKDTILFLFGNSNFNIQITDLIIQQCEFQNSTLFMFYDNLRDLTFLNIQNLIIRDSVFNQSSLIKNAHLVQLSLDNFQMIKNNLMLSNIISFNYHLNLKTTLIQENTFIESQVLKWIQTVNEQQLNLNINDVVIQFNSFKNSSIFLIYSSQLNNIYLYLLNIHLQQNYLLSNINNDQIAVFIIQSHQLHIQDVKIINTNDLIIFKIYSSFSIQIENILYENSKQSFKIPLSLNCNSSMNWKNQLFQIIGFFEIKILNLQVIRQFNVDSTLIEISSSQEFQVQQVGTISIENILFKENLQISIQLYNLMSLLAILAETEFRINLNNVQFIENFVHSYVDSTLKSAASLMLINTQASFVEITNIFSNNNGFTNSTNSFFNVKSNKIHMINLKITNHNILTQDIWKQYYDISLVNHINQENMNSLIIQIFKILNIGGALQLTSSDFYCLNCNFTNILAQRSAILQINAIKDGIIKLNQIEVSKIYNNIQFISNSSGCISINSQNSQLNLEITNTSFLNIVNRMTASIFTILPSQIKNKISLQNIFIYNCISLMNQYFYLQFSPQNIGSNLFMLFNVTIIQNKEQWIQYFSSIQPLSESEITEITGQTNALIYIENCQININGLIIQGLYISAIMKFINTIKFQLVNTYIQDIQLFYPCNIIQLNQDIGIKNIISFKKVYIERIQIIKFSQSLQKIEFDNYQVKACKLFLEVQQNIQILLNISTIQNQFFKLSQESLSTIQINSISSENQLTFQQIQLQQIDCSFCNNGLIYYKIENINYLILQDISCIQNNILSYGCLLFTQKDNLNAKILIHDSNFYNNTGSQGVGITALNSSLIINSCKILRNLASTYGGGLYLGLNNNSFLFNQSIILNNQAKYGGGIYLSGEYNLNKDNFKQTILLYNKAQNYANNLIESPTHLALYINQIEMKSKIIQNNNILIIEPYVIIEQEQLYNAKYLMLPSGQQIKDYEIILPKSLKTLYYINEIGLYFKNSRNEQLLNLINSTCNINSFIQFNDGNSKESSYKETIDFDLKKNNFDLSSLLITFDPYNQNGKYMEIVASCKVDLYNKTLNYLINVNTLKCQLGEFYTNQGCQKCIANQGFYSVTYDSIKCSIFDKNKFSNITSNQINLLEGFWRPHYLSDYTSLCYKNNQFCLGGWKYGNDLCSIGHIGALCEECDIQNIMGNGKYYKNQYHLECLICEYQFNRVVSFILVLLWAIISVLLTLKSTEKSNLMFKKLKLQERFNKILFKLNQDHESILMKMLLNYVWIFSLIFNFNIKFSITFNFIDSASNTSYFLVNNLDCYLSNIYNTEMIYSKIFMIFVSIFFQFLLIISGFMIYLSLARQQFKFSIISNTLLIFYILNYPGLMKMLCSIISNRWISNVNYIQGDVSLIFGSESHLKWMFYFVIPILLLFGFLIPFSLFILMYSRRKQLDSIKLRRHLCYLFNEYNDNSYFWEQIKLVQKVIMILISTQFETQISIKAYLFGICLLSYQFLTIKFQPYIISRLNHLDLYSGQICSMSIFLAAIKYTSDQANNLILSGILQMIIFCLCIKLCLPFVSSIINIYYKKNKISLLIKFSQLSEQLRLKYLLKCLNNVISKEQEKQQKLKDNYLKLKSHLISTSKTLLTNRKYLVTNTNTSSINDGKVFRISENFQMHQCFQTEPN